MRYCLAFLGTLLLFSTSLRAQLGFEAGFTSELRYTTTYTPFRGPDLLAPVGFQAYLNCGKRLSLNYKFSFATYKGFDRYYVFVHSPALFALGNMLARNGDAWGVALMLIPEGIGIYFRKDHKGLHLSANLNGLSYFHELHNWRDSYTETLDITLRYRFVLKKVNPLAISPFLSFGIDYRFIYAVGCTFSFDSRKWSA